MWDIGVEASNWVVVVIEIVMEIVVGGCTVVILDNDDCEYGGIIVMAMMILNYFMLVIIFQTTASLQPVKNPLAFAGAEYSSQQVEHLDNTRRSSYSMTWRHLTSPK